MTRGLLLGGGFRLCQVVSSSGRRIHLFLTSDTHTHPSPGDSALSDTIRDDTIVVCTGYCSRCRFPGRSIVICDTEDENKESTGAQTQYSPFPASSIPPLCRLLSPIWAMMIRLYALIPIRIVRRLTRVTGDSLMESNGLLKVTNLSEEEDIPAVWEQIQINLLTASEENENSAKREAETNAGGLPADSIFSCFQFAPTDIPDEDAVRLRNSLLAMIAEIETYTRHV
ncbi:hypothetical protein QBC34DRAFT_381020 [Podospora aff. communis PSN243]|uniref:Uncharacterized protein n=1 Tax=Podospora aff. communis PSN243 TaxID=3040156 RepID=A0AAV9GJ52_9PEZI|nr:hypothetical protein QBC34DRAFT_381020 [Podospora aff. communis PSN243]